MRRYDGNELKIDPTKSVESFAMPLRSGSEVFCLQQYDVSHALKFIEQYNAERNLDKTSRLTLFQVMLCAGARTFAQYPRMNRFITGKRYFQRNRLNFSFMVKSKFTLDSPETFAKFDVSPYETLDTIRDTMHHYVAEARSERGSDSEKQIQLLAKLPFFVKEFVIKAITWLDVRGKLPADYIEGDPMFCSAIVANLGSVAVPGQIIHHTYEYGNASMFVVVGGIRKGIVIVDNSRTEIHDVVDMSFDIDERVSAGTYFGVVLKTLQNFVEHPELLLKKPDLTESQINELNLVDLAKYKPYQKIQSKKSS
jgi:hypothetical protein